MKCEKDEFSSTIENGVREWVLWLREAGINTECSCGHEGYIQCQSLDPLTEIGRIKAVLHEHDLWDYKIELTYQAYGKDYSGWSQSIDIRAKAFRANLI